MIPENLDWDHLIALVVGMMGTFMTLFFTYRKNKDKVDADGRMNLEHLLDSRVDSMFEHMQRLMEDERASCEVRIERLEKELQRVSSALSAYQRSTFKHNDRQGE